MHKLLLTLTFLLALLPQAGHAQNVASAWEQAQEVRVRLISATEGTGDGPTISLGLEIALQPHWKTYWRTPGSAGLPLTVDWAGSENLAKAELRWPTPTRFDYAGIETFGYENNIVLPITVTLATPGQPLHAAARVDMMACAELCIPFNFNLVLDVPAGPALDAAEWHAWEARVPTAPHAQMDISSVQRNGTSYAVTVTADPPLAKPELIIEAPSGLMYGAPTLAGSVLTAEQLGTDHTDKPDTELTLTLIDGDRAIEKTMAIAPLTSAPPKVIETVALLSALLAAFIGGLILNLMPCVLPVLSLKLLAIVSHGGSPLRHVRLSFLASAAGIITSFLALAAVAIAVRQAGAVVGWGVQFQHPAFIIAMVAIITLFAASLFGLIHIPLPRFMADAINDRLPAPGQHDRTLLGNFVTGAFATILATPCSAPFVGTALGFAFAGSNLDLALVALFMGLGLATPFLLVAAFPQLANRLPRPGKWMYWLKAVLGIALLFTALWLGTTTRQQLGPLSAQMVSGIPFLLLFVLWIRASFTHPRVLLKGIAGAAVVLALAAGFDALRPAPATGVAWHAFDQARIGQLVAEGKTVFVDVTADWCLTCLANKRLVLDVDPTTSLLNNASVVAMKADWTRPDDGIAAYLKSFGRYGIPFNVVYGPGAPQGLPLPELLTAEKVRDALAKAVTAP